MQQNVKQRHEPPSDGLYLRFDYPNVGYVIDGLEDATVRYGFDRDLNPGDTIKLLTPAGNIFAIAEVVDVWTAPLRLAYFDMTVADGRTHPAEGTLDLHERMNGHYTDNIALTDEVTVVEFDVAQIGGAR